MLGNERAPEASADIVVHRCYFHPNANTEESEAGYCLTLFLSAFGRSPVRLQCVGRSAIDFAAECVLKLQPHDELRQSAELS